MIVSTIQCEGGISKTDYFRKNLHLRSMTQVC